MSGASPCLRGATRAYSLAYSEELSVGRVQTPTLAMVVERQLAIRSFVPEDYLEVVASFRPTSGTTTARFIICPSWVRAVRAEIFLVMVCSLSN